MSGGGGRFVKSTLAVASDCNVSYQANKLDYLVTGSHSFSFSHGHENDAPNKSLAVQNPTINETVDRLQVTNVNNIPIQRRESFLYRSESDGENSQPPRTSRHSSVSSSDW